MEDRTAAPQVPSLSVRKKIAFSAIAVIGVFLSLEIASRVGAFVIFERSPYFLVYGLRSLSSDVPPLEHSVFRKGYFKFTPNKVLHQYGLFREPTPIRINNHGLRGEDFDSLKAPNGVRIVAIGESSTFGYFNRDDYTYPALLQRRLRQEPALAAHKVEVVNAGIPHVKSVHMAPMMREEIVNLDPDIVTLYAGYNDASHVEDTNMWQATARWIHAHFVTYVALKHLLDKLGGPQLHSRWATHGAAASREYVRRQVELHVEEFTRNVVSIIESARSHGVEVILIRQALRILPHEEYGRDSSRLRIYDNRVAHAESLLAADGRVRHEHATTITHAALMGVLDSLGAAHQLRIVDNISIVDEHPEYFASYVHLTEDGNTALADALTTAVLDVLEQRGVVSPDGAAADSGEEREPHRGS